MGETKRVSPARAAAVNAARAAGNLGKTAAVAAKMGAEAISSAREASTSEAELGKRAEKAAGKPRAHGRSVSLVEPAGASARQVPAGSTPSAKGEQADGFADEPSLTPAPENRAAGVAQMVAGGALAAVGVPMLILPGPGIAAIAGGATLAANGARKAFGAKNPKRSKRS